MILLSRRLAAEFIGTGFLLISVVGSGIMAERLSGGNTGLALLANAIATGAMLYVIITNLGPVSGAHFNPVVTVFFSLRGEHSKAEVLPYIAVQIMGGILGVWLCHVMFGLPVLQTSLTDRSGLNIYVSEVFATFGLLFVIVGGVARKPDSVPALVGLYITGAYWFTSSTSFANPAVTIARGFSDTFAGIHPAGIPMFILMHFVGVFLAALVLPWLFEPSESSQS